MNLPNTYTSKNETGCCPVPNIKDFEDKELEFNNKLFIRLYTKSFLYMPLNMGKIMKILNDKAIANDACLPTEQAMILSSDISPFKAEQLFSVSKKIDGADNVVLDGEFLSKVFEGPYKDAKKWYTQMQEFVKSKGKDIKKFYFFYTTCPKCAKHYGKNYVIAIAKV